jgi:hypothetical protein
MVFLISPKTKRPRIGVPGRSYHFLHFETNLWLVELTARLAAASAPLFSDSKLGNHFAIAIFVIRPEIVDQPPALAHNL